MKAVWGLVLFICGCSSAAVGGAVTFAPGGERIVPAFLGIGVVLGVAGAWLAVVGWREWKSGGTGAVATPTGRRDAVAGDLIDALPVGSTSSWGGSSGGIWDLFGSHRGSGGGGGGGPPRSVRPQLVLRRGVS
jgi:hypothetical protein